MGVRLGKRYLKTLRKMGFRFMRLSDLIVLYPTSFVLYVDREPSSISYSLILANCVKNFIRMYITHNEFRDYVFKNKLKCDFMLVRVHNTSSNNVLDSLVSYIKLSDVEVIKLLERVPIFPRIYQLAQIQEYLLGKVIHGFVYKYHTSSEYPDYNLNVLDPYELEREQYLEIYQRYFDDNVDIISGVVAGGYPYGYRYLEELLHFSPTPQKGGRGVF